MRRTISGISLAAALAGCAAPDLGPLPKPAGPASFAATRSFGPSGTESAALPGDPATGMAASSWPAPQWWRLYRDPQLDALIQEALASAPDVKIAAARIRAANGLIEQSRAATLPRVDGEATGGGEKQSYNNGIPSAFVPKGVQETGKIDLSGSFDLDLWGRNKAALAAATSDAEATRIDGEQAALMLSTGIASAYADLDRLFGERDVLERTLAARTDTAMLVEQRLKIGLDTLGDFKQAQSAVPAARGDLAANQENIDLTRHQIAALIGAGPDRGLAIARPAVTLPADALPADAGIALIGRRPDIAAARARADSAAARIKAARADFLPDISITGLFGLQALGFDNLFKGTSSFGNIGPAVTLPIFHGPELRGKFRQARGTYDEAVATYDKTLIAALQDVADTATSRRQLTVRLDEAQRALNDADGAYQAARLRYQGGLSNYISVLSAEDNVLTMRRTLADLQARRLTLDIALVRALGGGFRAG